VLRNRKTVAVYNAMMIPGMILLFLFSIVPIFMGIMIALKNYIPAKGVFASKWVGFYYFEYVFQIPEARRVFANTLIIAVSKIIVGIIVPVLFALMLNEIRSGWYKRLSQTLVYLPHFLSWVILGGVVTNLLSTNGLVNDIISAFGGERVFFLSKSGMFRQILVITETWKEFGFGTIIYLAALTTIDPEIYEAAIIDGAGRMKQLTAITLPSLLPTIVLMITLSLGNILNAGFDQVYNLYNPLIYETGDIIDTYVYRVGLVGMQYSLSTAVGLLKSSISMVLIASSNWLASRFAGYRIF
jgi:putative aldouronate transport system permease protein